MSDSSGRWLARQKRDPFVREARASGYRSRAAFKLEELDRRCSLFRPGARVLDLGAAPGSWAQYAAGRVGAGGAVVACDLLEIAPIDGVRIVQGDARDDEVQARILEAAGAKSGGSGGLDLVICDMAPNLSGIRARDQAEAMGLLETALDLARTLLRNGGGFVAKVFQGEGSDAFLAEVRRHFRAVRIVKPKASREASREVYLVAQRFERREEDEDLAPHAG